MSTLRVLRFGLMQGREDFRVFFANWRVWFLAWGVRSIFAAAMIALLGKLIGSDERVYYLLVGNAVLVGVHAAGWAIQSSTWDRWDGTYPLLVVSPHGVRPSTVGRSSIWIFSGSITSLTTFAVLALMFGLPLPWPGALIIPLVIIVICASAYAFALAIGAFVIREPRVRNIIHSFVMTILGAFTGANVPILFWPAWVEEMANLLPVTHGLSALRLVLSSGAPSLIVRGLVLEVAVGAAWFLIAWFSMNVMANAGRADGTIDFAGV